MGDAILLDERKETFRVEPLHDDDCPAPPDRTPDAGQRRRVVERRGREVNLPLAKTPEIEPRGEQRQWFGGRPVGQRTQHALRPAGCAGGKEHGCAQRLVGNSARRTVGRGLAEIAHARPFAGSVDDETEFHLGAIDQRRQRDIALRLRCDEHLRQTVVDDICELGRRQIRIDAGVVEPRALAGRTALDEPRMVLHEDRIVVESSEAGGAQEMRQAIAARLQFPVSERFARAAHDDRRLVGARLSVRPGIHPLPPTMRGNDPRRFAPDRPGKSRLPDDLRLVETRAPQAFNGRAWRSDCRRRPAKCGPRPNRAG